MWLILKKIEKNLKNVSVNDLETLLKQFWFTKKIQRWSHVHYYNKDKNIFFAFPHRKPVKVCYVKNLLKIIKENYEV